MEFYDFKSEEKPTAAKEWIKQQGRQLKSSQFWLRRFPVISWLQSYSWVSAFYDVVAGVTVGLVELPKCLAAAIIAGLPPQYGLYSSVAGYFVYAIFGTCQAINFAPTLLVAMLMRSYTDQYGHDAVVLITFLSGVIVMLIALLQLAPIVEFISYPVQRGFMSAAVFNIVLTQIVAMVGITGPSLNVIQTVQNIINGIDLFNVWDLVMGVTCIVILFSIEQLGELAEKSKKKGGEVRWWHTFLKYFALTRNVLVMVGSIAFVAIMIATTGESPVGTPAEIEQGFPPFRLPHFQLQNGNTTLTFGETLNELSSALIVVPMILLLEYISVSKAFADGKTIDTTQESLALGLSNTLGSLMQSIPVSASFVRAAVNVASGVRSPISSIYTGAIMLVVLGVLTDYLTYIPTSTLSAVIITSLIYFFKVPQVTRDCYRSNRRDLIPLYASFLAGLFINLTFSIVCGILVDLVFIIYPTARPKLIIKSIKLPDIGHALLVVPDKNICYPNIEFLKERIIISAELVKLDVIVIDGSFIHVLDTTSIQTLKALRKDFESKGKKTLYVNWRNSVRDQFVNFDRKNADLFVSSAELGDSCDLESAKNSVSDFEYIY
ncbi:sodium-independent sulfate anion transporter-like [Neocloeon triangulifer]|uniref:sodium-independent sulfate anion transporter-like n=1 Tax=Neocloeon triangulifer TaxID=2078957 RepID=UPI00286F96B9|nr:sodium-independent sulfate anion transporter-like [Neocloeon triangulifer]